MRLFRNKTILILLSVLLTGIFTVGCGSTDTDSTDGTDGTDSVDQSGQTDPDLSAGESADILARLQEANSEESLLADQDAAAFRYIFYYADGSEEYRYVYKDADRYVNETDGNVLIDEGKFIYGFDSVSVSPYGMLFIGDTLEEFRENQEPLSGYVYVPSETVTAQEEKDGELLVTTSITEDALLLEDMEVQGYETGSGDYWEIAYRLDPDSFEIIGYTLTLCRTDGSRTVTSEQERVEDPETYVPDDQLVSEVFKEEKRTVTVTMEPGTEQEEIFTLTLGAGCGVNLYAGGNTVSLYTDKECTTPYEGGADPYEDLTLYGLYE